MPPTPPPPTPVRALGLVAFLAALSPACAQPDLVVYCALDQEHAEALVRRFEQETGLSVRADFDTEANKTVGLVARIREERNRTRCDVFWNNEIANTVALANEGLLAPYDSPSAADVPDAFRDPERRWTGFAARARVLIVNTELADPAELTGTRDLLDPRWAERCGMARPLTGTTLTHAVALYEVLGAARADELLKGLRAANERGDLALLTGNAHVMRSVREGALAWGYTDTDDFYVAKEAGFPVAVVYPDQVEGEDGAPPLGTLVIPNTVAVIAGAPHPDAARRFVDWVLRPEVEAELAASRTMQIPVRPDVPRPAHVPRFGPGGLRAMEVDFEAVGAALPERQQRLKELFVE